MGRVGLGLASSHAALARALGGHGERLTEPAEVKPAIARAVRQTEDGTPALLEFITAKEIDYSVFR
jgi:acetolactate synthase-1/2/3 large subunit